MESLAEGSLPPPTCMPRRKSMKKKVKSGHLKRKEKTHTICFAKGSMAVLRGQSCGRR